MFIGRAVALSALVTAFSATLAGAATPVGPADAAKAEIWTKEQAIYASRGSGNVDAYLGSLATGYLAWPPFNEVPKGAEGLRETGRKLAGKTHEKLEMKLVDFTLNGTTAVIYYQTHRTMLADGTPVDQYYDSTHTWVRENGQWKVLGGMARARPEHPGS